MEVKTHHRHILNLAAEDNPNNARVDSYNKSLGYRECLAQGWIEELPKPAGNGLYFRITPAGAEVRYRPKVKSVPKRKPYGEVSNFQPRGSHSAGAETPLNGTRRIYRVVQLLSAA